MKYKIIAVERRGELFLAVLLKQKDDKQDVYLETGEKVTIATTKTICSLGTLEASDEKTMKLGLSELRKQCLQEAVDIKMLWECLDADSLYRFNALLESYFGKHTEKQAAALFISLAQDTHYFQWHEEGFRKISKEKVEALLWREKVERERAAGEEGLLAWLKGQSSAVDFNAELVKRLLEALKKYALEGNDNLGPEGQRLVQLLGMSQEDLLILLENKRVLPKDVNDAIHFYQLPVEFPKDALAESQKLIGQNAEVKNRRILSNIWNIAIDDAETDEVDDAISYHEEDGYKVIGVHIADVSATIPVGSALDKFAQERFATLYFPEGRMALFPIHLVKSRLTLITKEGRPTLSGFFYFDAEGNLVRSAFEETVLILARRGTYEDTANALGREPEFQKLQELVMMLRNKRVANGAVITNLPEVKIRVRDNRVMVQTISLNLPGHLVVSELMILFNVQLAKKFKECFIPGIFRVQLQKPEQVPVPPEHVLYPLKLRWALGGAGFTVIPTQHYILGAEAYTQATSPIRRYSDLLMHRQFVAYLRGAPLPYTVDDLQGVKSQMERMEKAIKAAEHNRCQFWIYKYLEQNKGKIYRAACSRIFENRQAMVFIPELMQEFPYHGSLYGIDEGTLLSLRVEDVIPRKRWIQWTPVSVPSAVSLAPAADV